MAALFLWSLFVSLNAVLQKPERFLRTARAGNLEFLTPLLVIRNEKLLYLIEQSFAYIIDGFYVLVVVRVDGNTNESVVTLAFPVFRLFGRDNANDTYFYKATDMGGRIHKDHDVQRVTVLSEG